MKPVKGLTLPTPGVLRYLQQHPWQGQPRDASEWQRFREFEGGTAYSELITELERLQQGLCAFCEIKLTDISHQIEHFHPKDPAQNQTSDADWMFLPENLMAACKGGSVSYLGEPHTLKPIRDNQSCGQYKGNAVLDDQILQPNALPPQAHLYTVGEETGELHVNEVMCNQVGISPVQAQNTITLLNLKCTRLRNARKAVLLEMEEEEQILGIPYMDDQDALETWRSMAQRHLLPDTEHGLLQPFFTTRQSYFGQLAKHVLSGTTSW